jgi:hypothetical protein
MILSKAICHTSESGFIITWTMGRREFVEINYMASQGT